MPLVDYFIPLLASLREFQQAPRDDAAALGSRIDTLVQSARHSAIEHGLTAEDFDAGLFPVVAWADEALIALDWPGARDWPRRLLQRRFFNLSTAGIEFFKRLELLERDAIELKEVYFVCLCLGFHGRYSYDRDLKALADIRKQLLTTLNPEAISASDLLIPEGYRNDSPGRTHQTRRHYWSRHFSILTTTTIVIPLAILIGLYGIYHAIINHMVNSISQKL